MRVLFVSPIAAVGGAERVLLDAIASLRKADPSLDIHVLMFGDGPLKQKLIALEATVHTFGLPEKLRSLGDSAADRNTRRRITVLLNAVVVLPSVAVCIAELRQRIVGIAPDVIHSNGIKAHALVAMTGVKLPIVWHIHDFISQRRMAARVLRRLGWRANCIAISDAVARDVQTWLPERPVTTVFNGVDLQRFSPDAPANEDLLDSAEDAVQIGMLATYARWKGQDVFIRAADLARRQAPQLKLRFYIVGGPIYATTGSQFSEEELRSLASAAGVADILRFIPFQDEPAAVYRALDIVVHASTKPEPFGLTIAEAMACGRAVVVCNAGGAAELCTNEVDALTSTLGDADEMAQCIIRLATDPALRARLGKAARVTAIARFDRDHLGPDLLAVYRSITQSSPVAVGADLSPVQ